MGPKVSERVQITLWDKDRLTRDDAIGVAFIDLADVSNHKQSHKRRMHASTHRQASER